MPKLRTVAKLLKLHPKHKSLVDKLFPKNPYETVDERSLKDLVKYVVKYRHKQALIMNYLASKIHIYAVLEEYKYVDIALDAFQRVQLS